MLAFTACHMIAATILLNSRRAFGAFLGICIDPIGSFGIIFTFFDPHFDELTRSRLMITQRAAKAKSVPTCTGDTWHNPPKIFPLDVTINSVLAVGRRAPLEMVFIFNISAREEDLIPRQTFSFYSGT